MDMAISDIFRDLLEYHNHPKAAPMRFVRGGSVFIEARQALGWRGWSFSSKPIEGQALLDIKPSHERTYYPLLSLVIPGGGKAAVVDAEEIFKAWSHVVPVAALPENCCAVNKKGDFVLVAYVFQPFHRSARAYWKQLVKEQREGR